MLRPLRQFSSHGVAVSKDCSRECTELKLPGALFVAFAVIAAMPGHGALGTLAAVRASDVAQYDASGTEDGQQWIALPSTGQP
jgi:hypothetical protein